MGELLHNTYINVALIISTNRKNKEPKKRTKKKAKKQIKRNKTKAGAKNHKTQNTKKSQKEGSLEVLSWGGCYVLSSCGSGLLRVSSFIIGSLFVDVVCVTWLLLVGPGERKMCENSLGDNRDV